MRRFFLSVVLAAIFAMVSPLAHAQQSVLVMKPGETIRFRPSVPQRIGSTQSVSKLMYSPPGLYMWLTNLMDTKGALRAYQSLPGAEGQEDFLAWVAIEHPEAGIPCDDEGPDFKYITDDLIEEVTARYLEPYLRVLCDWEPFYEQVPAGTTWFADEGDLTVTETVKVAGVTYAKEYMYTAPTVEPIWYPGFPPYYPLVPDHLITLTRFENGKATQVVGIQLDVITQDTDQDIPGSYVGPYYGYAIPQLQEAQPVQLCILASPMVPAAVSVKTSRFSMNPYKKGPSNDADSTKPKKRPWVGPAVGKPPTEPRYVGQTEVTSRGPYMAPGYPKKVVEDHVDAQYVEWNFQAKVGGIFGIGAKVPITYKMIKADFGVSGSLSPEGVLGFRHIGQVLHDEIKHIQVWWSDSWRVERDKKTGDLEWKLTQTSKWRQEGYERVYTPIWAATLQGWRPDPQPDGKRYHWPWENGNPYDPQCIKWGAKYQYPLPRIVN